MTTLLIIGLLILVVVFILAVFFITIFSKKTKIDCPTCGRKLKVISGSIKCPNCKTRIFQNQQGEYIAKD